MVPIEDTCDNKEDKNLSHLTIYCGEREGVWGKEKPSESSAGLVSRLGSATCQSCSLP